LAQKKLEQDTEIYNLHQQTREDFEKQKSPAIKRQRDELNEANLKILKELVSSLRGYQIDVEINEANLIKDNKKVLQFIQQQLVSLEAKLQEAEKSIGGRVNSTVIILLREVVKILENPQVPETYFGQFWGAVFGPSIPVGQIEKVVNEKLKTILAEPAKLNELLTLIGETQLQQTNGYDLLFKLIGKDKSNPEMSNPEVLKHAVKLVLEKFEMIAAAQLALIKEYSERQKLLKEARGKLESNFQKEERLSKEFDSITKEWEELDNITLPHNLRAIKEVNESIASLENGCRDIEEKIAAQVKLEQQQKEEMQKSAQKIVQENEQQEEKHNGSDQKKREQLVNSFNNMLDSYVSTRSWTLQIKDRISNKDLKARKNFIEELQGLFAEYIKNGTNQEIIIGKITKTIPYFPGFHLTSALNTIVVQLMEADSGIIVQKLPQKADSVTPNDSLYKSKIDELHQKLNEMEEYAEHLIEPIRKEVVQLAQMLRLDTNQFVEEINNGSSTVENQYKDFKIKFNARLHSKDDLMSRHINKWDSFCASLSHAVTVIGQALGINKLSERYIFFEAEKTAAYKKIEKIEEKMQDIEESITKKAQ